MAETVGVVRERERERESYNLVKRIAQIKDAYILSFADNAKLLNS